MSLTKIGSLVALVALSSFSIVACAANTDSGENVADSQGQDLSSAKIHECKTDADCVAVPKGGCCSNGWMEAVNEHHVRAYQNASKCTVSPPPMCPMYVVHDTRVPQCVADDSGNRACAMVQIADISCGGFVATPHKCPDGYSCKVTGNPDLPGKCEKDPEPTDCRSTGCGDGKYCSFCWGNFACIPNGAMC